MSLREQYPSLEEGHTLRDVVTAVLRKHGIVPDSGIVSDLTQATAEFVHGEYGTAVKAMLAK